MCLFSLLLLLNFFLHPSNVHLYGLSLRVAIFFRRAECLVVLPRVAFFSFKASYFLVIGDSVVELSNLESQSNFIDTCFLERRCFLRPYTVPKDVNQ